MFLLGFLTWDPSSYLVTIPYINLPITWYGFLFALGFLGGYHIFIHMFRIFLALSNQLIASDVDQKKLMQKADLRNMAKMSLQQMKLYMMQNRPVRESAGFSGLQLKLLKVAKAWRDKQCEQSLENRFLWENAYPDVFTPLQERAKLFAEKGVLYVIIATVLGARLGHVLFYEHPMQYLKNPLMILKTWEGGLASHGAIAAILAAVWLFARKAQGSYPVFTFTKLMDFISIPILFVCGMIRIGNFCNQEILGTESMLPWAIIFEHPADGSLPIPRHPAQLYEALFYFAWFGILYALWRKGREKVPTGRIVGLALIGSFAFRFIVEYVKTEQSVWMEDMPVSLLMGQLLSIPMVLVGLGFYFYQSLKQKRA